MFPFGHAHRLDVSIVVPVFNEAESLAELIDEIEQAVKPLNKDYEILLVDDGSTDTSLQVIHDLAHSDKKVKGIHLYRNTGKAGALEVGFQEAGGAIIITLDSDLQDDPAEIPRFIAAIEEGADCVVGWKKKRLDNWGKRIPSKIINTITRLVLGQKFHDMNCGYKAYRADVAKQLQLPGSLYRYIPYLLTSQKFDVQEIPINHRLRKHGKTKFMLGHRLRGPIDLFTVVFLNRYGASPMHLFGTLGFIIALGGASIFAYFVALWYMGEPISVRPIMIIGFILLVVGIQIISVGFIGELLVYHRSREQRLPGYRVVE